MASISDVQVSSLSLLILPSPPTEASTTTFRAAYQPALARTLIEASLRSKAAGRDILDVALSCPQVFQEAERPRSEIYPYAQHHITLLYQIVCSVCIENSIDLQSDNDVDVRIVLVDSNRGNISSPASADFTLLQGPVIDMTTLSTSYRPWTRVYSIESEEGEEVLQKFVGIRRGMPFSTQPPRFTIDRLAGGTILKQSKNQKTLKRASHDAEKCHYSVAVGGTFDHLHVGHKLLLSATALVLQPKPVSQKGVERVLTIGITGDELLRNKKYAELLESFEEREKAVCHFLSAIISFEKPGSAIRQSERHMNDGPNGKAIHHTFADGLTIKCVEISDPYGPTITDESISALVVSGETRSGGKAVNEKRSEKGWSQLAVFEIDVLDAGSPDDALEQLSNFQSKVSSTEVRRRLHEKISNVV
ncbi:hypothetical protein MMC13_000415 [Lambiella insularis]|nr:hypothetical protein [Lambiella insularis]